VLPWRTVCFGVVLGEAVSQPGPIFGVVLNHSYEIFASRSPGLAIGETRSGAGMRLAAIVALGQERALEVNLTSFSNSHYLKGGRVQLLYHLDEDLQAAEVPAVSERSPFPLRLGFMHFQPRE
jgi:hypothetical protein